MGLFHSLLTVSASLLLTAAASAEDVAPNAIPPGAWVNDGRPAGLIANTPPFTWACDVGANEAEQRKFMQRIAAPAMETTKFFKKVYGLKDSCFEDFTKQNTGAKWEPLIRINLWRKYADFLTDYQRRYETKSIPGAFFGISAGKDAYGKPTGKYVREIATATENMDDQQLLRHLYHEMGHLFMRTYMASPVEVPSWIEEGNAELFQFRVGNGTKPEDERLERQGWLREMLEEGSLIPWSTFTAVRNMDNLGFTYKDHSRSIIQYAQAWSVIEFMISNNGRQAAYLKMLEKMKKSASAAMGSKIKNNKDAESYLYGVQNDAFKESYGVPIDKVESQWKDDWVTKEYERLLKTHPILLYHRGNWLLTFRVKPDDKTGGSTALIATAEERFAECVKIAPKCPEGHVGLGQVAMLRKQFDVAEQHFTDALTLDPNSFDALLRGGIAKSELGKAAEAVPLLTKATTRRPTSAEAHFHLGRALSLEGRDLDAAAAAFAQARELRQELSSNCGMFLGTGYFVAKQYAKATAAFYEAAYAAGGDGDLMLLTALSVAWDGDTTAALQYLERAPAGPATEELKKRISGKQPLPTIAFKESNITLIWPGAVP
jgi:tetratricopeptide (TPR) repeat protein